MSDKKLLEVKNLHVDVEDKQILHGVNLEIGKGETHVLMGPNGTGKSTLGYALMGNPRYTVREGEIWFDGKNITEEAVNERAKAGIFLSFQNPLEVPGVTLSSFIRNALEQKTGKRIRLWDFKKELERTMEILQMDPSYAERDLNVGFSGGEKKKADAYTDQVFRNLQGISAGTPIYENYDTHTGKPMQASHFSWSAACLIMMYNDYGK